MRSVLRVPFTCAVCLLLIACTATREDTVDAGQVCPIHGVAMQPAQIPIVYGLPSPAEFEEMKVAKELFPYGRPCRMGGCVVKGQKEAAGFLCPKCVAAREAWLKTRASTKN